MKTTTILTDEKTTALFPNLFAAIKNKYSERLEDFKSSLEDENDTWQIISKWQYNDLMTASKKNIVWDLSELKSYLIDRKSKALDKELEKGLQHLLTVEKAPELESIKVSVEWKKNRTWGSNPTAEAWVSVKNDSFYYTSGSIGGCGYDKRSTAIANAVNQDNSFLKALYLLKEKNVDINNHTLFGYGSGYGILPKLEGGVGESCYAAIFDKIGFKWNSVAWGKTYDVYTATKII